MDAKQLNILVAEDDPNDALLIKRAFSKIGINHPVHVVADGEEAIAYFAGNGKFEDRSAFPYPQFFITDLKMPKKSGFEVLAWLKQHPEFTVVPTIVLSSSKQEEDVKKAYQLGANSYLTKPADFAQLQDLARKMFEYWSTCERPQAQKNG